SSFSVAFGILTEAALSFLGMGTQPPTPSWGIMLSMGRGYLEQAPWLGAFPGLAIFLAVLGFNLLGPGIPAARAPRCFSSSVGLHPPGRRMSLRPVAGPKARREGPFPPAGSVAPGARVPVL